MTEATLIKIHDVGTLSREIGSDISTFGTVLAFFAVGWFFDSAAMEWFAFVMAFLILLGRAVGSVKKCTPQEAADFLRDKYNVTASEKRDGED